MPDDETSADVPEDEADSGPSFGDFGEALGAMFAGPLQHITQTMVWPSVS